MAFTKGLREKSSKCLDAWKDENGDAGGIMFRTLKQPPKQKDTLLRDITASLRVNPANVDYYLGELETANVKYTNRPLTSKQIFVDRMIDEQFEALTSRKQPTMKYQLDISPQRWLDEATKTQLAEEKRIKEQAAALKEKSCHN